MHKNLRCYRVLLAAALWLCSSGPRRDGWRPPGHDVTGAHPLEEPGGNLGQPTRRQFLHRSAALTAPLFLPATALGTRNRPAPSDRITLGVIGTGNQGFNDTRGFLSDERVQVVAVCDVNKESAGYWNGAIGGREPGKRLVEQHYGKDQKSGTYKGCDAYVDFRELLARKDVDAVLICTPDHWHAIPTILAAKAGKDIYCQKPLSLTIAEGRAMANAVKKYERVFSCGSQQRSDSNFRRAAELVRNGRIGKLHTVRCGLPRGRPDLGKTGNRKKPEAVPEGFDYDFWLGPAPQKPYAPARCHVNFRWLYDYSGGQVTDWGGPPSRLCPVGHGDRADRARRDSQRQGRLCPRRAVGHSDGVHLRSGVRQRREADHLQQGKRGRHLGRYGRLGLGKPR